MRPSRILAVALVLLVACGASARQKTLTATLLSVDTAKGAFVAFDAKHQLDIVNAATSKDDGAAKLASYRERRAKVVLAFEAAYRAVAIGAVLQTDPKSLANVVAAGKLALDEWHALSAEIGGGQ